MNLRQTVLGALLFGVGLSHCGSDEKGSKGSRSDDKTQPEVVDRSRSPGWESQAPYEGEEQSDVALYSEVDNEEALRQEYEDIPVTMVARYPVDENGREDTSQGQYRSFNDRGTQGHQGGFGYHSNWNQGRSNDWGQRTGFGPGSRSYHSRDRHSHNHYNRRPHYPSRVNSGFAWVFGSGRRYTYGNWSYYIYNRPRYNYSNGRCHNYYRYSRVGRGY